MMLSSLSDLAAAMSPRQSHPWDSDRLGVRAQVIPFSGNKQGLPQFVVLHSPFRLLVDHVRTNLKLLLHVRPIVEAVQHSTWNAVVAVDIALGVGLDHTVVLPVYGTETGAGPRSRLPYLCPKVGHPLRRRAID
jgi:hypothetical protein